VYRPRTDALDDLRQQAPGFWAQKSSNCWASDPSGGGWSFDAESSLVSGAAVPPLASPVVPVPVLPLDVPLSPELLSVLESGVLVAVGVALELSLDDPEPEPSPGAVWDCGTDTAAGGPGTCVASVSPPPQPAATRASRPAVASAMMRPGMWLTPP
jgi:hypothetical protein